MNLIEALEAIEAAPRGNARLDKIKELEATDSLKNFLAKANDPFITFGVADIPEVVSAARQRVLPTYFRIELFALADKLASRELSGNAAREAIEGFLGALTPTEAKWGRRFLLKDLRLNIGGKEVQKVFGKDSLYLFEVPLADSIDDVKKWDPGVSYIVEPKLDGGRCVCIYDAEGNVSLLSRTGKGWPNFASIKVAMTALGLAKGLKNFVIDGEVVSLDDDGKINFQQVQKTMRRQDGIEVGRLQYVAFDCCTLDEWKFPKKTYGQRYAGLKNLLAAEKCERFRVIDALEAQGSVEDMKAAARNFVNEGYEGGIIRKRDDVVENKRSKRLLKVKFFQDSEAVIIGADEGEGRHVGTLGALLCKLPSGIEFKIGSGFIDEERQELWADLPIGALASFKFFETTNDGCPRFPIWKGLRSADDVG